MKFKIQLLLGDHFVDSTLAENVCEDFEGIQVGYAPPRSDVINTFLSSILLKVAHLLEAKETDPMIS